jgi:hypothetical protein
MRLDARNGNREWLVFDVKRCRQVREVVWCDDETAQWGRHMRDLSGRVLMRHRTVVLQTVQEDRITIYPTRKLVLFNEVDDDDSAPEQVGQCLTDPALA